MQHHFSAQSFAPQGQSKPAQTPLGLGEGRFTTLDFVAIHLSEHFDLCLFYLLAFTQVPFERAWRHTNKKEERKAFFKKKLYEISMPKTNFSSFVLSPKN